MATNHYFRNFSPTKINEQRLYEDLLAESIRIHGHDVWYLPRESWENTDFIFGENVASRFERAYQMEMYIANVEGWEGEGDIFSKFGLEIRENSNFIVAKKVFDRYVPTTVTRVPRGGDLIYVPVMEKIFEIKFVEEELLYFAKGLRVPYIYELRAEVFRYTNERINTGVDVIDTVDDDSSYTIEIVLGGTGNYNIGETVYQGSNLASALASGKVTEWDPNNRKLYIVDIKGTFENASGNVKGAVTNTSCALTTVDTHADHTYFDMYDNKDIQTEANTLINTSETNPFGAP
jgi:hypothetical protein